ncbi:hypothetical protein [Ralstonia solanacearum]|uniref:hypothetical protein n=1 Tax=Ralstonia solanacearum TaxID=305 RepID=UPI000E5733CB|nr:hypothetical protein [Ralstonia solanacearum]AXW24572.1 hypothetical protein CJO86_13895 [Ralstonia solanacearum]
MQDVSKRTCIYCNIARPFTDEHVFPAGLGGDDRRYLLKGLVCGHCNTGIFSKLEGRFMRSSPTALARVFMQPHGRGKGKKASIPRLETRTTSIVLPKHGAIEAEVTSAGKPVPLMQLILSDEQNVRLTGGDHGTLDAFAAALSATLADTLHLVRKEATSAGTSYRIETWTWTGGSYQHDGTDVRAAPVHPCVWLEHFDPPANKAAQDYPPRLYHRLSGQIVLRTLVGVEVGPLLTLARKAREQVFRQAPSSYETIDTPLVHINMSMNLTDQERVLAKIGVNFAVHLFGERYVRHHAFNRIKRAILNESQRINCRTPPNSQFFDSVPIDKHVLALSSQPSRAGRYSIVLHIRLYGSTSVVVLTENAPKPPIPESMFLVIDYAKHRIEQLTMLQFVRTYPPHVPDAFRASAFEQWARQAWPTAQNSLRR